MRKILGILCLLSFLAITGFSQGLSVPAPFLRLFPGSQWAQYNDLKVLESFDELNVKLGYVLFVDQTNTGGFVELLVLASGDKKIILAGWAMPRTELEQGFIKVDRGIFPIDGDELLTKMKKEGEALIWKLGVDQFGNSVLVFFFCKREPSQRYLVKFIDVKEFVEENF